MGGRDHPHLRFLSFTAGVWVHQDSWRTHSLVELTFHVGGLGTKEQPWDSLHRRVLTAMRALTAEAWASRIGRGTHSFVEWGTRIEINT